MMMLIIYVLHGGVIEKTITIEGTMILVKLDIKVFLAMIIAISLLGIARNVLEIINFLTEKETSLEAYVVR